VTVGGGVARALSTCEQTPGALSGTKISTSEHRLGTRATRVHEAAGKAEGPLSRNADAPIRQLRPRACASTSLSAVPGLSCLAPGPGPGES
jgi:hypothetical protein